MTGQVPGAVIAVVDDDARIVASIGSLLESADYVVRRFVSASALLESGCLTAIDCLISDIDMPEMDGVELLRVAHAVRPGLPVILITGHPELLDQLPPVDPGEYRLLKKPFDSQRLLAAVGAALGIPASRLPQA